MDKRDVLNKEEIHELLKGARDTEVIEKESAISWDGRNLIIRIPKEIAEYLKIDDKNRFNNNFKFLIEEKEGKVSKTFDIVERTKPRKEKKKNATTTKKNSKKNNRA